MKTALRTALIITSLALMAFAAITYVKTGKATAEGELVGFVDSDEIVDNYAPAKQAQDAWESFQRKHDEELQAMLYKKYQTEDFNSLTPAQQAEVQDLLKQSEGELKDNFEKSRHQHLIGR